MFFKDFTRNYSFDELTLDTEQNILKPSAVDTTFKYLNVEPLQKPAAKSWQTFDFANDITSLSIVRAKTFAAKYS